MSTRGKAPLLKSAIASTAYTTTTTSAAFALPVDADTYMVLLQTTAATGTSPTMDAVLQSSPDNGTTYINLPIRSTQITAAGQNYFIFKQGLGGNEVAFESPAASTGGTLAKNCIFDPRLLKVKFTIGGTNPSITTQVWAGAVSSSDCAV